MSETFYIIDGHAQIFRAFYAPFRALNSPSGEPTRATYVFSQMLLKLVREKRPDYLAMVLDVADETVFRREVYPEYKANREPAPEDLIPQFGRIIQIVESFGIPIFKKPGYEADDLMATIAQKLCEQDLQVYLVSKDKDLEQLISDCVFLYDPHTDEVIDAESLLARKGYRPDQAVEVQALCGDTVDNIPGVPGIGPKTAAKLIQKYGTARAVLEHADELTPKQSERVKEFAPQLPISRMLVELDRNVDFEFSLEQCRLTGLRVAAVRPIFQELGFGRLTEQLDYFDDGQAKSEQPSPAVPPASSPMPSLLPQAEAAPGAARYVLVDNRESLADLVQKLRGQKSFAFDTETTGLNCVECDLVGLSFCWRAGEAWYIPVRAPLGSPLDEAEVLALLKPIFEDESVAKVGQNIKYDALVLRHRGIHVGNLAFDTQVAAFLLDPARRSFSLDALARACCNHEMIPITDLIGKGKNQLTMDQVDVRMVCEYAAEDADYTWRLKELFEPQIIGGHLETLWQEVEMPLLEVLAEMEFNGVALDVDMLKRLGNEIGDRLLELQGEIHRAAGRVFNVDSTRQLAEVLFDDHRLGVVRHTKTGRSTDADTLLSLTGKTESPIPRLVLEYRELSKLKGTYVDTLPKMVSKRTGRVHASFHQTGAVTGRLSSSDPNLQNIPIRTETGRQIRRAFVAGRPDHLLLTADYSQIELRLLAHFCKDPGLLEAFAQGQDIHRTVAAQVNGVPPEEVTTEQRGRAKAVNFGIIYGQTAFGLARSLGIPVGEAKNFIDAYFHRYPGIRSFINRCIAEAREKGFAQTLLGRRRPIPELRSRNRGQVALGERLAVNTVVQGSAADLIKKAMIDIHRSLARSGGGTRMLIQVHDELVFEAPAAEIEQQAKTIRRLMEQAIPLDVPIVADIGWAKTWAESK